MTNVNPSAENARENARQADGKFGEQSLDTPTETTLKTANLLSDSFEMTPDRERILSVLLNPEYGGEFLAYGDEETPEEVAAAINDAFPTSDSIEAWNVNAVADALNKQRYENGQVEINFGTAYDGDGVPDGFNVGVWLGDSNYLTQYMDWREATPRGAENGLEAAVMIAESIEYRFESALAVAKRHGLITEDGNQTLDWKNKPQREPVAPADAKERANDTGVYESVVRVPVRHVIGVDNGTLTSNLAEAQVENGRPYSLDFDILNVDNENDTVDVRVRNNVRDMLALS